MICASTQDNKAQNIVLGTLTFTRSILPLGRVSNNSLTQMASNLMAQKNSDWSLAKMSALEYTGRCIDILLENSRKDGEP